MVVNLINDLAGRPFWPITRVVYLGMDDNPAAWYSSVLLAVAGLLAFQCFQLARQKGLDTMKVAMPLFLFAGLLFVMSCDEIARFHENVGAVVKKLLGVESKSEMVNSGWVMIGGWKPIGGWSKSWVAQVGGSSTL